MSQRVLDNGEVAAGFEQVRGEPVAVFVWRVPQIQVGALGKLDKDALDLARRERYARLAVGAARMRAENWQLGKSASLLAILTQLEIRLECVPRGLGKEDDSFFVAF